MNGYAAIVAARFRTHLQYRAAALAGLATQLFFGSVRIMIFTAFYAASTTHQPLTFSQAVGYIWLGQATFRLVPWRVDPDVAEQIYDGSVVYELTRPLDLYTVWFARALAWRTAPVFLRMIPTLAITMLLLPFVAPDWALVPPSAAAAAAWLACFAGAVILSASISAVMNVALMWTIAGDGVVLLVGCVATLLGGLVIPLAMFPDWAQPALMAQPFAGMLDLPARIFTGALPPAAAAWVVAVQLGWAAALFMVGRWLLGRGLRRLVVQGG